MHASYHSWQVLEETIKRLVINYWSTVINYLATHVDPSKNEFGIVST